VAKKPDLFLKIKSYLGDNYRESDDQLIDLYCKQRKLYEDMLSELRKEGFTVEYTNKAGATNVVKNPLAIEVTKSAQVLTTILKSLGLTPSQRKEAGGGDDGGNKKHKQDEFASF
jgi:P27 family predicted phage terminase small subunit